MFPGAVAQKGAQCIFPLLDLQRKIFDRSSEIQTQKSMNSEEANFQNF